MGNGCDVVEFSHSHQDPCSTILNILQSLHAFVRDPDEKCVTVIQSGGDKGVDQFSASAKVSVGRSFAIFLRW